MKIFQAKPILWSYLILLILIAKIIVLNLALNPSPWLLCASFLSLMLCSGFALARLANLGYEQDRLGNLILWLTLGMLLALTVSLLGILTNLTIFILIKIYFALITLVGLTALITEFYFKKSQPIFKLDRRTVLNGQNLLYLLAIACLIVIVIAMGLNGALFRGGDPSYHLAIMRKAFEGGALSAGNLGFVKGSIHIAYGFPVWHVFLALFARLFQVDTFALYGQIVLPLTVIMILVWTWLMRQILGPTLGVIGIVILMVFNFYYPFTVLVLPDALSQYLLLPLVLVLALKYVSDPAIPVKMLAVLAWLLVMMAAIHVSQYVYFLLIMLVYGLIVLTFFFEQKDWLTTLKRIGQTILTHLAVILPVALFLELKNKALSETIKGFMADPAMRILRYAKISKLSMLSKLAYLAAPLVFFFRQNRAILFLAAIFLMVPIFYLPGLSSAIMRVLGYIFLNRLYANVNWYFVIWALAIGFLLIIFDRLIRKIPLWARIVLNLGLAALLVWMVRLELSTGQVLKTYQAIFSTNFGQWLNTHYWWVLSGWLLLLVVILIIARLRPKINDFFRFEEPRHWSSLVLLLMIISFFLVSPRIKTIKEAFNPQEIAKKQFSYEATANLAGGVETINFIRTQLPAKSVFLSNGRDVYLAMLADQAAAAYPHSADEKLYDSVFGKKISSENKLKILTKGKIDYILLSPAQENTWFDQNPQYFTKIFNQKAAIYQIDKQKIKQGI